MHIFFIQIFVFLYEQSFWPDSGSTLSVSEEEYNSSLQEKLPLIIGSAAAGVVFLIAVVVLIIVCNR